MKKESKGTGDDKEELDMTKYGSDKKDGDPNKEGMVKYLWQKVTGASLEYYKVKEEKEKNGNGDENGKSKSWWVFSSDNIARPLATYTGIVLGVVVIVGAIFWEKISAWWSGPAEEEGQGAEESDEKEE